MRPRLAVLLIPAVAVVLAACGSTSTPTTSPTSGAPAASPTPSLASLAAADVTVTGPAGNAPVITFAFPADATELTKADATVGTGKEVTSLDAPLTIHYTGIGAQTGKKFDSSWDRNEPLVDPLSVMIPGWQNGIPGMKVGGRRVLVVPGDLAYGANSGSPDILPNETLVFVIDLIKVG